MKDHLYDLDSCGTRFTIVVGAEGSLVEYKQEAYTMFVDLMSDIYNIYRGILKASCGSRPPSRRAPPVERPKKRYNAMGILEDIPAEGASGDQ